MSVYFFPNEPDVWLRGCELWLASQPLSMRLAAERLPAVLVTAGSVKIYSMILYFVHPAQVLGDERLGLRLQPYRYKEVMVLPAMEGPSGAATMHRFSRYSNALSFEVRRRQGTPRRNLLNGEDADASASAGVVAQRRRRAHSSRLADFVESLRVIAEIKAVETTKIGTSALSWTNEENLSGCCQQ